MAVVFVEARPKGGNKDSQVQDYVVEDHADHVMATFPTQNDAIVWAIKNRPQTARAARSPPER